MDSIVQIDQSVYAAYHNHYPFYHTLLVRLFVVDIGMSLFKDANNAVMVYSVFQILSMSAIFAYICLTLYEAGVSKKWTIFAVLAYAFGGYHMMYSITMWKDVLFGGVVALFLCALYRVLKGIGRKNGNYILLVVGALGTCLLRSNGMAAFVLFFIILFFVLRKTEKKALWVLLGTLAMAVILKYPVIKMLNVPQPDMVEFLSIPEQQIARLIADDVPLEEDEIEQLEKIADLNRIKENYLFYLSDPVKNILRQGNPQYLEEHKWDYFLLWLRLGLKHPGKYLEAWIDQTKGFWNGGYDFYVADVTVFQNSYGIELTVKDGILSKPLKYWINAFLSDPAFQLFKAIGLHVWMIVLCGTICAMKKKRQGVMFLLPMAIILTLLITTPVFAEFRYAYGIFTSFPFLMLTFFTTSEPKQQKTVTDQV